MPTFCQLDRWEQTLMMNWFQMREFIATWQNSRNTKYICYLPKGRSLCVLWSYRNHVSIMGQWLQLNLMRVTQLAPIYCRQGHWKKQTHQEICSLFNRATALLRLHQEGFKVHVCHRKYQDNVYVVYVEGEYHSARQKESTIWEMKFKKSVIMRDKIETKYYHIVRQQDIGKTIN